MAQISAARPAVDHVQDDRGEADLAVVFLRLKAVIRVTGLSRSTLYRLIAEKEFPRPVRLGLRAVAWRRTDVEAWSETRPTSIH